MPRDASPTPTLSLSLALPSRRTPTTVAYPSRPSWDLARTSWGLETVGLGLVTPLRCGPRSPGLVEPAAALGAVRRGAGRGWNS